MKKTFPLTSPNHQPPRVVAAIKNEVRKYFRRERRKVLPDGARAWQFRCRVGLDEHTAEAKKPSEVIGAIDWAASQNAAAVYIEILAIPGERAPKGPLTDSDADAEF
jgi:hypothetical protein